MRIPKFKVKGGDCGAGEKQLLLRLGQGTCLALRKHILVGRSPGWPTGPCPESCCGSKRPPLGCGPWTSPVLSLNFDFAHKMKAMTISSTGGPFKGSRLS